MSLGSGNPFTAVASIFSWGGGGGGGVWVAKIPIKMLEMPTKT